MPYLRCSGSIDSNLTCSTGWEVIPNDLVEGYFPELSIADGVEIAGAVLLLWGTAFGVRFIYRFLSGMNPGRF